MWIFAFFVCARLTLSSEWLYPKAFKGNEFLIKLPFIDGECWLKTGIFSSIDHTIWIDDKFFSKASTVVGNAKLDSSSTVTVELFAETGGGNIGCRMIVSMRGIFILVDFKIKKRKIFRETTHYYFANFYFIFISISVEYYEAGW